MEAAGNYHSGDDYVVEFLGYRFSFNSVDFEERVTAAAVRLGLVAGPELPRPTLLDVLHHRVDEIDLPFFSRSLYMDWIIEASSWSSRKDPKRGTRYPRR